ncbi:MAG: DUF1934 domain-containing protein [Lachnospiraceae bacterium]|nr:DUF1934 domain-containing protein [Lachnospiraceae bacterium]MCR5778543.1 DUF1934 domain-containing protein [Lachnospiraceae bacterium]
MKKDVMVTVSGLQMTDTGDDTVEVITNGKYSRKDNKSFLRYEEVSAEMGATKTVMSFDEHTLEVTRRGAVQLHMAFLQGQKTMTNYATPFGSLLVGVDTTKYVVKETEDCIDIMVEYSLELNHEFIADCRLKTKITPRNAKS